jgi:hypothetical protein
MIWLELSRSTCKTPSSVRGAGCRARPPPCCVPCIRGFILLLCVARLLQYERERNATSAAHVPYSRTRASAACKLDRGAFACVRTQYAYPFSCLRLQVVSSRSPCHWMRRYGGSSVFTARGPRPSLAKCALRGGAGADSSSMVGACFWCIAQEDEARSSPLWNRRAEDGCKRWRFHRLQERAHHGKV